jgi:hypothetical protein
MAERLPLAGLPEPSPADWPRRACRWCPQRRWSPTGLVVAGASRRTAVAERLAVQAEEASAEAVVGEAWPPWLSRLLPQPQIHTKEPAAPGKSPPRPSGQRAGEVVLMQPDWSTPAAHPESGRPSSTHTAPMAKALAVVLPVTLSRAWPQSASWRWLRGRVSPRAASQREQQQAATEAR